MVRDMAVQPDKRSWAQLVAEGGRAPTERFRVGIWTLQAPENERTPLNYFLRCDRPRFPNGTGVSRTPHDGWTIWDGDARFSTWASPLECLEWWAARHERDVG